MPQSAAIRFRLVTFSRGARGPPLADSKPFLLCYGLKWPEHGLGHKRRNAKEAQTTLQNASRAAKIARRPMCRSICAGEPTELSYGIDMLSLVPFASTHFPVLSGWFASEADVAQWGGTVLSFPLTNEQLGLLLSEADIDPPKRLCWMAEHDG